MVKIRSIFVLFLFLKIIPTPILAAQTLIIDHNCTDASQIPQNYLDDGRSKDVFFNHQSVGYNILDGLADLAALNPTRYSYTIMQNPSTSWYANNDGLGHFTLGSNLNPDTKVNGFNDHIAVNGYGVHVDVAMMKFCYVDFYEEHGWWGDWTGEQVWNYYRPIMESLEAAYPNVTFVWWTCPLHTQHGNFEHQEFNSRLRQYCYANNKVLFDLAAIESHDPNGNLIVDANGYPALYSGYTTDGGHLNLEGRQRVAKAWWWLMARISGWNPGVQKPSITPLNLLLFGFLTLEP